VSFSLLLLFFYNGYCSSEKVKLVVALDDFDFKIRDVAFEAKVFERYNTFDQL